MPTITPNLWFDTEALPAAEFYCSVFPNSTINDVSYYGEGSPGERGAVMTVNFTLDGTTMTILNGGPEFPQTEAVSFFIDCADQDEVDYYWDALLTDGGEPSMCGWLKDRYGVSWQVIPGRALGQLLGDPDPARAERAIKAMLTMRKIDLGAMRAAADGTS